MNKELTEFLRRNRACAGGIARLSLLGAETLEDAWNLASPADLIWGVTRPGVMDAEQRRQFLVFVLESIEDKLTDPRSKNILDKLRANSPITEDDASAADAAYTARAYTAAWTVASAAMAAARAAAWAVAEAADAAEDAAWASWAAAYAAARADAAALAAAEAPTKWIRENIKLSDLHIN